jgi:hypothetical protein
VTPQQNVARGNAPKRSSERLKARWAAAEFHKLPDRDIRTGRYTSKVTSCACGTHAAESRRCAMPCGSKPARRGRRSHR